MPQLGIPIEAVALFLHLQTVTPPGSEKNQKMVQENFSLTKM